MITIGVDRECRNYPRPHESEHSHGRRLGAALDLLNTSSTEISVTQGLESVPSRISLFHTDVMNTTLVGKNLTVSS